MTLKRPIYLYLLLLLALCSRCTQREKGCMDTTAANYNPDAIFDDGSCLYALPIPTSYTFERYDSSAVNYSILVPLHLALEDIRQICQNLAATNGSMAASYADTLQERYSTANFDSDFLVTTTPIASPTAYSYWSSFLAMSSYLNRSYGADSLVDTAIVVLQTNAITPKVHTPDFVTNASEIDFAELLHKTLLAATTYYQASLLLNSLASQNNSQLVSGQNYTAMENAWDKAFGHWGMARNFAANDNATIPNTPYNNANGDNVIDLTQEYHYFWVQEAARRTNSSPSLDFNSVLFEAFRTGRTAIANKDEAVRKSQATTILLTWEKLIAANLIHHLNALAAELNAATPDRPAIRQHWTAAFAYCQAFYNNSKKTITNEQAETLLSYLGSQPPANGNTAFLTQINDAKTSLQQIYEFSADNLAQW
jgi:hypothetical protein